MKKRDKRRTSGRGRSVRAAKATRAPGARVSVTAVESALKRLRKSVASTISGASAVVNAGDAIATLAADRTKAALIDSLLDEGVLAALYELPTSDATSAALRIHARWLQRHFNLEPICDAGQTLEVPAARLAAFDLIGPVAESSASLCKLQVRAIGWKRAGSVLRKPVASVIPNGNAA
jgi:hypothetical protein